MTLVHDELDPVELSAALAGHPFVSEILYRASVGSTNDVAKARAAAGASEGLLVVADAQTAGRGRIARRWWAPPSSALLTSLLFRPAAHAGQASSQRWQQLMMLCALAAADAVAEVAALRVELKWPNDLMARGRKLAGLLAEATFKGDQVDAVIVGLGLNVNMDLSHAPPFMATATSISQELGRPLERLPLLVAYVDGVARRYDMLKAGQGPFEEWVARLSTLGQRVTADLGGAAPAQAASQGRPQHLTGVAEGVDADGALLLRADDGTLHHLLAADVSLQGKRG